MHTSHDDTNENARAIETGGDEAATPSACRLSPGDIVRNFKRETVSDGSQRYLYRIVGFARHSETNEDLVVYEALYPPFGMWARPRTMFMSEVDHAKYPDIRARWRFEPASEQDLSCAQPQPPSQPPAPAGFASTSAHPASASTPGSLA